jgi:hypothetical protein
VFCLRIVRAIIHVHACCLCMLLFLCCMCMLYGGQFMCTPPSARCTFDHHFLCCECTQSNSSVQEGIRPQLPSSLADIPGSKVREVPLGAEDYLDLMQKCWHQSPESRPSFEQIVSQLEEIYKLAVNHEYVFALLSRSHVYQRFSIHCSSLLSHQGHICIAGEPSGGGPEQRGLLQRRIRCHMDNKQIF